jgi:uncharacterized phiE125 gp8 family phage protein
MDRFRYALRKLTPSAEEPVSLAAARANCAVDGTDHDATLVGLLAQAREYVEEKTDCSLLTTEWEMTLDAFPRAKYLYLPRWPLQSITAIEYTASDGTTQEIDDAAIRLRLDDHSRGRIALAGWSPWPVTASTPDAVAVRFVAGWPSPELVPAMWSRAILMLVAWWLEQREAGIIGGGAVEAPIGVAELLNSVATTDDFGDLDLEL